MMNSRLPLLAVVCRRRADPRRLRRRGLHGRQPRDRDDRFGGDWLAGAFHGPGHDEAWGVFDTTGCVGEFVTRRDP